MNDIEFELKIRLNNNLEGQKNLEREIEFLPKGHINILYRKEKGYYYLTYREGKKIHNDYLGPVGKADLNKTIEKLKKRQLYEKELLELKKEEKTLKKLIKNTK